MVVSYYIHNLNIVADYLTSQNLNTILIIIGVGILNTIVIKVAGIIDIKAIICIVVIHKAMAMIIKPIINDILNFEDNKMNLSRYTIPDFLEILVRIIL